MQRERGFVSQDYWRTFAARHQIPLNQSIELETRFGDFYKVRGSWNQKDIDDFLRLYKHTSETKLNYWATFSRSNDLPSTMTNNIQAEAMRWMDKYGWDKE